MCEEMTKICDLHTHSVFSDGTCTPAEIIDLAIDAGLCAVALTDHNTVDGIRDFLSAANGKNIEAVAGIEFSAEYNRRELHLLALDFPSSSYAEIAELMADTAKRKEESNIALIESIKKIGISIDYECIKANTPNGKVNRAIIAYELTRLGYTASVKEAFSTLLSKSAGHYKEPKRPTFLEMLDFTNSIGAIPILAHPFLNLSVEELYNLLPTAKSNGLKGLECCHSLFDKTLTDQAIAAAKEFGLKCSGGSDFHGDIKPDIKLGVGKGDLSVPYEWLYELRNE